MSGPLGSRLAYELACEGFDDVGHDVSHVEKIQASQRDGLGITEQYRVANIGLHLHLGVFGLPRQDAVDLCAVFKARPIAALDLCTGNAGQVQRGRSRHAELRTGVDYPVLVDVVEDREGVEVVTFERSLVRLVRLDLCPKLRADPMEIPFAGLFELLWRVEDRELVPLSRPGADHGESPNKMIQRGSERVENLPHEETQPDGWVYRGLTGRMESDDLLGRTMRIVLDRQHVTVRIAESAGFSIKGFEVIPGPRYLFPTTV